ncbi:MAG: pyridoxal-phosphate dependent enzyme [Bacteroidetes bacterium]|nr:pyridoxal-phosphate dependent enzyme [Bacteroidota bacterium]
MERTQFVLNKYNVELYILRIDLIDTFYGGNKYFKLKYNITEAKNQNKNTLLTFGGAFSNHIVAVAASGKKEGFRTIGIIRGEKILPLNKILQFASENGMQLEFIARQQYRTKENAEFINDLKKRFGDFYLLPEGGSNDLAVKGCSEIINLIEGDFDYIVCATATGATLSGIASVIKPPQKAIGICVLNNELQIKEFVKKFIAEDDKRFPEIITGYTFGGYAKSNLELNDFVKSFIEKYQIPSEPIYTGKMLYAIIDLMEKNYFKPDSKIIAVHTGGLQYL